jgi:N-methylhydantoinase A/oxoprolinase/acetone carboxylase beta subunit
VVRSWASPGDLTGLEEALTELAASAGPGEVVTSVDCRYEGQSHELNVPTVDAFPQEHRRRNGYVRDAAVEVVALRARSTTAAPLDVADLPPPPARGAVVGPAVVAEEDCTIWVPDGWRAEPGPLGALVVRR